MGGCGGEIIGLGGISRSQSGGHLRLDKLESSCQQAMEPVLPVQSEKPQPPSLSRKEWGNTGPSKLPT